MDTTNTAPTGTEPTNDETTVTGLEPQTEPSQDTPQEPEQPEQKREVTAYEKELRDENKQRRLEAKALREELDAFKNSLATALGMKSEEPGDVQATVETITRERDDLATKHAQAERENAVLRAAHRLDIDGDALLDSRRFCAALADLDSDADDYSEQLTELIKNSAPKPAVAPRTNTATPSGDSTPSGEISVNALRRRIRKD